jgi:hypothetical protein
VRGGPRGPPRAVVDGSLPSRLVRYADPREPAAVP